MNIQILKSDSKKGFKKLVGINRETSPAHINKLRKSILEIGMVQAIIVADIGFITGKKETYIIEGQHKYEACIALGLDIPYVTINTIHDYESLVKTIALLNSNSKPWKLEDYIHSWSSINGDYRKLLVLSNKYKLEAGVAAYILSGYKSSFSQILPIIKKGEFKVDGSYDGEYIVSQVSEIAKALPKIHRTVQRYFIREYISVNRQLGKSYDHSAMLGYIRKQDKVIMSECINESTVKSFFAKYLDFINNQESRKIETAA